MGESAERFLLASFVAVDLFAASYGEASQTGPAAVQPSSLPLPGGVVQLRSFGALRAGV